MATADDADPRSSTWTTLRWDGASRVALLSLHMVRLRGHAERLGIVWPDEGDIAAANSMRDALADAEAAPVHDSVGLMRLRLLPNGSFKAKASWADAYPDPLSSTAVTAPRWVEGVTGTKHGDWQPYSDAASVAGQRGADVALLVHDETIVDCCRATPILLDDDGTAWYPDPTQGSLDSVTLEALRPGLATAGVPLIAGRLTTNLLSRARTLVAVGSGVGAIRIATLDGQQVGSDDSDFPALCSALVDEAFETSWHDLLEVDA